MTTQPTPEHHDSLGRRRLLEPLGDDQRLGRDVPAGVLRGRHRRLRRGGARRHGELRRRRLGQGQDRPRRRRGRLGRHRQPREGRRPAEVRGQGRRSSTSRRSRHRSRSPTTCRASTICSSTPSTLGGDLRPEDHEVERRHDRGRRTTASTCRTPTSRSPTARTPPARRATSRSSSTAAAPDTWSLGSGDTVNWAADTQAGNGNPASRRS